MAQNNPTIRELRAIVESYNDFMIADDEQYASQEDSIPEFINVKFNGRVIGLVWQEGPGDWGAELDKTGMSWAGIDTQEAAEEFIRDEYLSSISEGKGSSNKDDKPYAGTGKEPYATMKDGPDKYLFRKDGKQKLVGSKDNECDYGEEELEETSDQPKIGEKIILQKCKHKWLNGLPAEVIEIRGPDDFVVRSKEGNHLISRKQIQQEFLEKNKMNKELDRLKTLAGINENQLRADLPPLIDQMLMDMAQMTYAFENDGYKVIYHAEITPEKISELKKIYHEWKRNAGDDEGGEVIAAKAINVLKGEMVEDERGIDSPFTHSDPLGENEDSLFTDKIREDEIQTCLDCEGRGIIDGEDLLDIAAIKRCKTCHGKGEVYGDLPLLDSKFREDLLLAPQDKPGPEVDEDDMIYGKTGKGKFYGSGNDHENEFAHDEDAMVDLGDDDNYYDDDIDSLIGDSGNMYEMNRLRELAGLDPIIEKKADKDYDGDGKIESGKEEFKGSKDKAIKKELEENELYADQCEACDGYGCFECGGTGQKDAEQCEICDGHGCFECDGSGHKSVKGPREIDEADPEGEEQFNFDRAAEGLVSGKLIPYEIDDERAYYMMADILGAELDFGPEDEILVPAAREDEIVLGLEREGFVQGKDFWRADAQYEADLQNGYNDRAFSKGDDYFPKGAQSTPASDLGPSASGMADNPMSNKMRMVKKDSVYETMKLAYRRFRKS